MSDLSEKIKNKLDNRYGDNQQMTDNLIKSNGAWYNSGVEQAPANPILDTLGVFGGSLIGGTGDLITGLATDGRDFARKQWQAAHDANPDLFPDNEKPYDFGDIAVDLGRTLSDYGAKMTANHMRVGNAPNNQPWASTKLEDRIFNPDYWSDIANGPGTDLAMMAGSFVPQMALMAVAPETKIAEGIGEAINVAKVAKSASAMEKAVAKAKQFLGSDAAASMERWGIAGGPTTAYMNSGGIYGDLAEQGYNDDQIADAMRNMRYEELPQDFLTSSVAGLGVSGAMGRLAKGAGKIRQGVQNIALNMPLDAAAEYYDEANQQRIQNKYTNKPYGKDIFHLTDDEQAAGASAVVPSLLLGVAGGVRNALPKNSKWRKYYDKLTGNRYTPDNPANQPNSINADTQTPDSTVATNVNDTVNAGYDTMVPAFEGANVNYTGAYGTPAVTTEAVTNAAAPFMGVRMDNGSNGCVEAVTKIGASTSSFLNNELSNGVVGVPTLVSDAEKAGVPVVAYSPDNVAAGDIIVYGDNDHVVMADGQGGYVGNSSSQQQVVHGSDLEAMGGISPTKIIKTGGNNGFTMASINEDDVFSGLDDFDIEDIFDLYSDSNVDEAGNKTEFPGYSELVDADTKKISKDNYGKAVNNEEFMKGLMDYVYSLIYDDNVNLARIASYNASKHGNLQELARINKMISENDTEGISEVANEVRSKLNTLATNYFTAIDKSTQDYTSRLEKATGEKSVSAQVANTQQNEPVTDVENATNLNSGENIPSTANEASMPEYVSNDDMDYSGLNEALNSLGIGLEDAQPMQTPQSTEQILNAQAPRSTASSQQMTQPAAPLMLEAPRQTGYPAQSPEQWMMQALGQQNTMQPPATGNTAMASQQEATQSNTEQVNVREMTEDEALNGPVADTVAQRKEQARVLRNIAQANDIELPKKLNAGLDSGAKKAVAAAQSYIKHELAKKAEADNNESESTSTKETKTTEGQHTEDKIQHTEPEQGNEEKKDEVKLADGYSTESGRSLAEADEDEFIIRPDGSKDFGEITQEIEEKTNGVMEAGPVRLQVGNGGHGYIHLLKHLSQIQKKGYANAMEYINHILNNFNQIYNQSHEKAPNRFVLFCKGDESKGFMPIDLEFEKNGDFYSIVTVFPRGGKIKGTLIFDESATSSTATANGELLPDANNKGGVVSGSAAKDNVPMDSSISQNTSETKPEDDKSTQAVPAETEHFTAGTFTHTKTGQKIPRAKIKGKTDKYKAILAVAKKHGGIYSRFAKCFLFDSEAERDDFVREAEKSVFNTDINETTENNATDNQQEGDKVPSGEDTATTVEQDNQEAGISTSEGTNATVEQNNSEADTVVSEGATATADENSQEDNAGTNEQVDGSASITTGSSENEKEKTQPAYSEVAENAEATEAMAKTENDQQENLEEGQKATQQEDKNISTSAEKSAPEVNTYNGFTESLSSKQQARIAKTLSVKVKDADGKRNITRAEYVEKAVADDRPIHEVETDKGTEYRIYTGNDDNSYVKVTKTEYDYAKFLGAKPLTDKVTAKTEVMSGENYKDKEADDSKDKAESKTDNQAEDNNKAEKTEGKEKNSKESSDKSKEKIEDFGEYLYGARKDYYGMYAEKLRASDKLDLNKVPLSKFWPEPNYNKLLESGADKEVVAFIRALRDMVAESMPSKRSWRYDQWASMAKRLNKDAKSALEWGMMPQDFIFLGSFADAIKLKMQMYKELGHDVSLKDIHIDKIDNGMLTHNGNEYRGTKDKPIYMVRGKARRNFWNSWPYLTIPKNSVEEAIAEYKKVLDKQKAQEPTQRIKLTFKDKVEVGRIRGEKTYMLYVTFGSKSNWTTLAEGFESVSEARKYLDDHADELEKIYNAMKAAPPTRRSTNSPRVGTDYRNGQDVTPEMFTEAFGFRGVQFGNWVEGDRRQQDINQAYDALMDLAGVIQVSPRALSLGGELGLAFGARGKGGKDAAAAHYEPGAVVINLTKRSGAGSLAHEWFHAVDHYLAWSHDDMGLMTDGMSKKNRQEVIKAFESLRKTFKETGLYKRSKLMDETRKNPYYTMNTEMGARSFESYVKNKLKQQNQRNDYLANISSQKAFDNSEPWWDTKFKDKLEETGGTRYPYPLESELGTFEKAFDHLFDVLEEKVEDRKTILYSVSDESAEQMSVNDFIDAIHSEFPYAKNVQQDGNLVSLEMPGGQKLHISLVDKIAFTAEDKAAAEKAYGRELSAAETPQGKYEGVGQDGFITLTKDNKKGTISHEAYHFAKQFLDDKAKVVLEKRYKNEEAEAEAFRKWRNARNRSGMLSKIWQKIQDTASSMADLLGLETEHAVFRSIESGDVFKNNAADGKLAKDSANWRKALKEAWNTPTDTVKSGDTLKVMDTPLVLQLIGAKYLPMNIRRSKIEAIKNKHPEMTLDVLSELPNNLADPMFIFKSTSYPGRYIIALELKDKSGVNVVVPVIFDEKDGRVEINRIATAYGKDGGKKAKTNYKWFTDNIENGNTVYINKEKVTDFYQSAGLQLPLEGRRFSDLFGDSIKTEEDLVKLKNENPAKYSIGEQSENNNPDKEDIRFSVSNDTGTKENVSAMTEEQMITEVKQAFPTAKNINADGSSVTFTLPNGHKVTVNYVKRIGLTEAEKRQAAADYGREITDNDVIEGRYHGLGQEAFIEIAEGGREGTINHEAFHYAMEAALTQKMKDFLNKKYNKSEEAMAEAFRKWCNDRAHSDKLGKIWNKVKDFASSIANLLGIQTKQGIFKDIASGKAFEGMTYDISNTKYALTYNAKVTLFKRIAEHVDAAIKDMQNAGKTDEYIKDQLKGYPNFRESFMQKLHSNYETNVVKDLEGRRLIVERIARHRGIRPGDLDYDEVVKESKELISRAEEYFTQICEDRASNVGFSAGIVTPNDATRIRNGILGSRQVNRRGEKALHSVTTKATTGNGGGSSYAKFSINTNDNSKPGFVQRIRNLFKGEKKNSTEYRRMVQNIMEDLSQCKIRWGKMDEGLASIYKEAQKVIRVAKPYDWANALPNVGYAVAKRLGIEDSATPETSKIANYIADWVMTGAPNNTSQEAKDFAEAMKNNPYMADKLLELQNIFMQYSDKSTHDFHQNVVSFERPREKDYFHNFAMKLYDQFIEELGPVQRMVEGIEKVKKEKIPKNLNPYVAFRLFRGHYGKAMTMVEGTSQKAIEALQRIYPHVDFNGFKTIHMILDEAGALNDKAMLRDFSTYCVACHVADIHRKNDDLELEKAHITKRAEYLKGENERLEKELESASKSQAKKIEEVIEQNKAELKDLDKAYDKANNELMDTPMSKEACEKIMKDGWVDFSQAQADLVRYSNTMLAILYDSGVISKKRFQNTLSKWPNYVPMFRTFDENEAVEFGDSMKAQKGSTRQVVDPIESIIRNTYDFVKRGEKNRAKLLLANFARCTEAGEYIEEVETPGKPNLNDVITFYEQGTKKYLATDPAIVSAVNGMGRDNSSMALALFNAGVRVARACFVTINPTFAIRNLIADTQDAMIYSEYGYKPWDFVQGFMHALKRDDVFYEWMASGAAQASALSLDRDYTRSTIDKMTRSTKDKITNPKTWLNWLQWAGEVSEYGTRIGVYQRTKDAVGNKDNLSAGILEAAYESRDLMDFARGGKASRHLNKIALFANASIQGMDKFRRAFDPRDKKQFMRSVSRLTFTAMLPALLLALAHYDDDWYDELPDWMKESHWILGKVGDTIIRIPKGHDVAIRLVSNFIEKAISKTDKVTLANQFKPLKDALPSLMPMGLLPVIESWTNYSMFTEGPVVPGYLSKLPEDKQYNARTTWLARTIGDVFGYSPMKIDHIMEGYSGNVYKSGMEFINWMARDNKSAPHITDLPVISGVTYMPYKNPASVTKFYNEFDKLQKQHAYYNQTHEKLPGYSEEKYKKMMKASKKMSELSRKERDIVADEKLTVAKRYELQRQIQEKRLQLARSVLK